VAQSILRSKGKSGARSWNLGARRHTRRVAQGVGRARLPKNLQISPEKFDDVMLGASLGGRRAEPFDVVNPDQAKLHTIK